MDTEVIETVTVQASRLIDWQKVLLAAVVTAVLYVLLKD